jgi:hypothetical protein
MTDLGEVKVFGTLEGDDRSLKLDEIPSLQAGGY